MKQTFTVVAVAFSCFISVRPLKATFLQIATPTAGYVSGTTLIPITAPPCTNAGTPSDPCPAASIVSSMTNGGFTVSFSSPDSGNLVLARAAVPVGWATWNVPPFVESATPRVLQDEVNLTCATCTLNLTFSTPVQTFGVEMEPDPLATTHTISETFLNGGTIVGNITDTFAGGNKSAMLFAGTTDQQFTSVQITIDGTDFALAQVRLGPALIPEPGTVLLTLVGLGAIGWRRFRKR